MHERTFFGDRCAEVLHGTTSDHYRNWLGERAVLFPQSPGRSGPALFCTGPKLPYSIIVSGDDQGARRVSIVTEHASQILEAFPGNANKRYHIRLCPPQENSRPGF